MPVALMTVVDGVCHRTSAALIISRQHRRSIYPDRSRADHERMNENNNRDREIGQSSQQRLCLIAGGWAGLVAATGEDSAGVSQTDAGQPWAAAAAAWLVIHGVAAGMRRESQRRLWDVGYTGGGRLERRVKQWVAQRRNVSPDWLINYPMQAVHPVYRLRLPVL